MAHPSQLEKMLRAAAEQKSHAELVDMTVALSLDIATLRMELCELKERLGLNSENSSKPPSSDPPGTPTGRAARRREERNKRKQGAQPGHKGHARALVPEDQVNHIEDVFPTACSTCGGPLQVSREDPWRHQVWELPAEIAMLITEYRLFTGFCPCCCTSKLADLPDGVTWSPFGSRLRAGVSVLSGYFKQSDRMVKEFLEIFFDFKVSVGGIVSMRQAVCKSLADPHAEAHKFVQEQPVVHADETTWLEKAKRSWLWTATTIWVTVFLIRPRRWSEAAKELLHEEFSGILVSDRFSSYKWVDPRQRQLCWSHLLRDFHRIAGREGPPGRLGRRLEKLGAALFHEWHRLQAGEISRASFRVYASRIRVPIRRLFEKGTHLEEAKTAGTCKELLESEPMMWTFARVEGVPPTNNQAERSLRPAVIKRKLSYGTQSPAGSLFIERIMTAVATLRQQPGRNVLDWLTEALDAHVRGAPSPSLLPATAIAT